MDTKSSSILNTYCSGWVSFLNENKSLKLICQLIFEPLAYKGVKTNDLLREEFT